MKKYITSIIVLALLPLTTLAVNVRDGANGNVIGTQNNGSTGTIQGGGNSAGGYYWWNVDFDSGTDGWVAEDFLDLYSQTPPPPEGGQVLGINGPVGPDNDEDPGVNNTGTDYYLSCSGNDNNSGSSPSSAWRTLNKLTTIKFSLNAGDRILFERGCKYYGNDTDTPDTAIRVVRSGTTTNPIKFEAYGAGDAPVISGAKNVQNWTQHQGNIWKANIGTGYSPRYLFANNESQNLAKHPNSGFLFTDNRSATGIQDSDSWLTSQPSNSLVGGRLITRTSPWSWGVENITSNSGNSINVSSLNYGGLWNPTGWAYMVENKLSLLDSAGEWYYDSGTGDLYFWAPGNANPNNLTVEISVLNDGINNTGANNIIIKNLVFENFNRYAIRLRGSNSVADSNEIRHSFTGINHYTTSGNPISLKNSITNNYIHNTHNEGIYTQGGNGHLIENNVIENIATNPQLAADYSNWNMFGIRIAGSESNTTIRYNKLKNIGYIGISSGGEGLIEKNIVEDSLYLLTDGSGIALDFNNNLIVRQNIIKHTYSNMSTMPFIYVGYIPLAKGIYFGDKDIQNTKIDQNIIIDVESDGIWMDHGAEYQGNEVTNNIVYGFTRSGIGIGDYSIYQDFPDCAPASNSPCFVGQFNDVVTGNKLYGLASDENPLYLQNSWSNGQGDLIDFFGGPGGNLDNNYYFNPYRNEKVRHNQIVFGQNPLYTLPQWKNTSIYDQNSTEQPYTLSAGTPPPSIYYNETTSPITVSIGSGKCDYQGNALSANLTLQPFTAVVPEECSLQ